MEENVAWNVALVRLLQEMRGILDEIRGSNAAAARVAAFTAQRKVDEAIGLVGGLPKMIQVDELAGLPDDDLMRILAGGLQALREEKHRPTRRALAVAVQQALFENPDIAQKISLEAPSLQVSFQGPEEYEDVQGWDPHPREWN